jgi:hypothetical protein
MVARNLLGDLALEATQADLRDTLAGVRTPNGKGFVVGNARSKFRDGFASATVQPEADVWTLLNEQPDTGDGQGHIVVQGGDANGASYLRVSMSPFVDNSAVWLSSKQLFSMPSRIGWGISVSQRFAGQELLVGYAEADDADPIGLSRIQPYAPADIAISVATVTSNVLVLTLGAGHPFKTGDRVIVVGCADTRLNVGPVYITATDALTISVPLAIANGSYAFAGGAVRQADPLARANNAYGLLFETANVAQVTMTGRRNGTKARVLRDQGSGTTAAANPASWADTFIAPTVFEQSLSMDECVYRSFPADSNSGPNGFTKMSQSIPDEERDYRLMVRARNLDYMSRPVARITSIAKTGTTTATVTTDRPHGLTTTVRVGIYGVRDQTGFPNSSDLAVASVPTTTTFTVVIGAAATLTSTEGGIVYRNEGQVNSPGAQNFAIQSISRANNVLAVVMNTTTAVFVPGEYIHLWGLNVAGAPYEGAYKVLRQNGATLELASTGAAVASFNTGGAVIRRTEYRLHFVRILDHTRHFVEILGGRGNGSDANNAVPVTVAASTTIAVGMSASATGNPAKAEDAVHATGDVGMFALGVRAPATPTVSTSAVGDYSQLTVDAEGKMIVVQGADPAVTFQSITTLTATAAVAARAAQAAGIRTYVTDVTVANTSATAARVDVLDGATVIWSAMVPANDTFEKSFRTPLRGTAATALNVQMSAAVTDVRVSVEGYSGV